MCAGQVLPVQGKWFYLRSLLFSIFLGPFWFPLSLESLWLFLRYLLPKLLNVAGDKAWALNLLVVRWPIEIRCLVCSQRRRGTNSPKASSLCSRGREGRDFSKLQDKLLWPVPSQRRLGFTPTISGASQVTCSEHGSQCWSD